MTGITYETATDAFEDLFDYITSEGFNTDLGTRAIYNANITIFNPLAREIITPWRKFSKKYAEREFKWYLSGNRSVEELEKYAPKWGDMHGGDFIVNSNYGWQWQRNDQLETCIKLLEKNIHTRQAWVSIFDGKERYSYMWDTPCTMAFGFDVKRNSDYLDMTVMMRSCDLIWGFCNDQYCFTKLQEMVADRLKLKVGCYTHFAHDLHIYSDFLNLKDKYYEENN